MSEMFFGFFGGSYKKTHGQPTHVCPLCPIYPPGSPTRTIKKGFMSRSCTATNIAVLNITSVLNCTIGGDVANGDP